jgi:hypothetical protein
MARAQRRGDGLFERHDTALRRNWACSDRRARIRVRHVRVLGATLRHGRTRSWTLVPSPSTV